MWNKYCTIAGILQLLLFNTQKYESHMHISFPIWALEDVSSIFVPRVDSRGDVSFVFHA